jgi:hypothetical protein
MPLQRLVIFISFELVINIAFVSFTLLVNFILDTIVPSRTRSSFSKRLEAVKKLTAPEILLKIAANSNEKGEIRLAAVNGVFAAGILFQLLSKTPREIYPVAVHHERIKKINRKDLLWRIGQSPKESIHSLQIRHPKHF